MTRCRLVLALSLVALSVPALRADAAVATPWDFNGDGFGDLAVGAPGESGTGAVAAIYGSSSGLRAGGDQLFTRNTDGIPGSATEGDAFGSAVTSADFNGDGFADLAVGIPGHDDPAVAERKDIGAVVVVYGSGRGLRGVGAQQFAISGRGRRGARLGTALAAGRLDGDRYPDLAVGAPFTDVGDVVDAGSVFVLPGSSSGLRAADAREWHQGVTGVKDEPAYPADAEGTRYAERFGSALAIGDFNGSGIDDLAIGVPGETVDLEPGTIFMAGGVNVLYGRSNGLSPYDDDFWHQGVNGVKDEPENHRDVGGDLHHGEWFGAALAAGDVTGDRIADLAVGVPRERLTPYDEPPEFHGAVHLLRGGPEGVNAIHDQFWHQEEAGVKGTTGRDSRDFFGAALAIGNFDGARSGDLAIGIPGEVVDGAAAAGAVAVLYSGSDALTSGGDDLWTQAEGIDGSPEPNDRFGASLTARNFGRGARADLAIGAPREAIGDATGAGRVHVIYGASGGLTYVGDQTWDQARDDIAGAAESGDRFGAGLASPLIAVEA